MPSTWSCLFVYLNPVIVHRDPRYFSPDPEEFWPERWLGEGAKIAKSRGQDFKLNQGAYMPFNYGPGNCVGRSLALHEIRTALASLVRHFDARFAPGFQPEEWLRQLKDYSGLIKGKLEVVLSTRV
jgi:cytochrome P450